MRRRVLDEAPAELREQLGGVVLLGEHGPDHRHTERPLDSDPEVTEQGDEQSLLSLLVAAGIALAAFAVATVLSGRSWCLRP